MATTETDKLGLKMQAAGDNPGTWEIDLNAGFVQADARFYKSGSGDPNIAVQADFIDQRYLDTDTGLWWTAYDIANPSTWWSDAGLIDVVITHQDLPTILPSYRQITARLMYVGDSIVKLVPTTYGHIRLSMRHTPATVEEAVTIAGEFEFDLENDLEGAQTIDADTAYYLYLDNLTVPGTPEPLISKFAPGPKGYHTVLVDHMCVGSFMTDRLSDIHPFWVDRNGEVRFYGFEAGTAEGAKSALLYSSEYTVPNVVVTSSPSWKSLALNIPLTSSLVRFMVRCENIGAGGYLCLGLDGAAGTLPSSFEEYSYVNSGATLIPDAVVIAKMLSSESHAGEYTFPIVTMSAPAISYGNDRGHLELLEFLILGYTDIWAPKY